MANKFDELFLKLLRNTVIFLAVVLVKQQYFIKQRSTAKIPIFRNVIAHIQDRRVNL